MREELVLIVMEFIERVIDTQTGRRSGSGRAGGSGHWPLTKPSKLFSVAQGSGQVA